MAKRKRKTTGFGHALRVARVNAGLSQKELGDMIGARSNGYISMWETGSWMPSERWLAAVLDVFPDLATYIKSPEPEISPVRTRKAVAQVNPHADVATMTDHSKEYSVAIQRAKDLRKELDEAIKAATHAHERMIAEVGK